MKNVALDEIGLLRPHSYPSPKPAWPGGQGEGTGIGFILIWNNLKSTKLIHYWPLTIQCRLLKFFEIDFAGNANSKKIKYMRHGSYLNQ
jgi:hypothetical protein